GKNPRRLLFPSRGTARAVSIQQWRSAGEPGGATRRRRCRRVTGRVGRTHGPKKDCLLRFRTECGDQPQLATTARSGVSRKSGGSDRPRRTGVPPKLAKYRGRAAPLRLGDSVRAETVQRLPAAYPTQLRINSPRLTPPPHR